MKMKMKKRKKARSKTPGFMEILKYLPGEMKKVAFSPVKKFGRYIKGQIDKELNFRDAMQEPTRSRAIKFWQEQRRKK